MTNPTTQRPSGAEGRLLRALAATWLLGACAMSGPARLLLLSGRNNHDWRVTTPRIKQMYEDSGRFAVDVSEAPGTLRAGDLADYQAIVSNWNAWGDTTGAADWPDATRAAVLAFVRSGKGFVVVHAGSSSFYGWPQYHEMTGATWKLGQTGHGPVHQFRVAIAAPEHPVTRGMGTFWILDELWHRAGLQPDVTVLATALSARGQGGTGQEEPVAVCKAFGKGRSFALLLGHDLRPMGDPAWCALLCRGTEWAATGRATIPLPEPWQCVPDLAVLDTVCAYEPGQDRSPLHELSRLVQVAADQARARPETSARLAAALGSAGTAAAKHFLCSQIAVIGSDAALPALTALLADPRVSVSARGALEAIGSGEARGALRGALSTTAGQVRVGLIQSLGRLRHRAAVPDLVDIVVREADRGTQAAALRALGSIGSPRAGAGLHSARGGLPADLVTVWSEAGLTCADRLLAEGHRADALQLFAERNRPTYPRHVRVAAFAGQVACEADDSARAATIHQALGGPDPVLRTAALHAARQSAEAVLDQLAGGLGQLFPGLSPGEQMELLGLVEERELRSARVFVLEAAASASEAVREKALAVSGVIGDAESVSVLVSRLAGASPRTAEAAAGALSRLRGEAVDARLLTALTTVGRETAPRLVDVLAARRAAAAVPRFRELAQTDDHELARRAVKGLSLLADAQAVPDLLRLLAQGAALVPKAEVRGALAAICQRRREDRAAPLLRAMAGADGGLKAELLQVLPAVGGDAAMRAVVGELGTAAPALRLTAVRALATWPDAAPLVALFDVAKQSTDTAERTIALRGVTRMLPAGEVLPLGERAGMACEALGLADGTQEKQALLSCMAKLPTRETLAAARECLTEDGLSAPAALSVIDIAEELQTDAPQEAAEALRQVLHHELAPEVAARATVLLRRAERGGNLAYGAEAGSDDGLSPDGAGKGPWAAVDGNEDTYWDEQDNQKRYHLRITLRQPADVAVIVITGYRHHDYAPKDFDVLCDGKVVKRVVAASYTRNQLLVTLPDVRCAKLELDISGYYGASPAIRELEVYSPRQVGAAPGAKNGSLRELSWQRDDTSVALLNGDRVVWRFDLGPRLAKPLFHPVALLDGTPLTWDGPPDHPWHHALWFSWKFVNGVNYWEEDRRTGRSAGLTEWTNVRIATGDDFSARVELDLSYRSADGEEPILTERRVVGMSPPAADGTYLLDWAMVFTAGTGRVELNRTPPPGQEGGKGHGGYAGLSVRFTKEMMGWAVVSSEGVSGTEGHGKRAAATDFSGAIRGSDAGIAIIDHPLNPGYPTAWFLVMNPEVPFAYFSPAYLFHEAHVLDPGGSLTLRYRVVVHPDRWGPPELRTAAEAFATIGEQGR